MSLQRVAGTYAKSLLDLAIEENKTAEIKADMDMLSKAMESRDLFLLLKSPIISKGKKGQILNIIFEGKLSKLAKSFVDIIVRKGRENILPEIVEAFDVLYKQFKNISSIKLITAQEISNDNLEAIRKQLTDSDLTSDHIDIETEIDPSIIGGFVIEIGDKLYDASIAHQMQKLRKELLTNAN